MAKAKKTEGGNKSDFGKCRYDLIPPCIITYDALVFTMGADKYADHNWTKGIKYSRLLAATFRHIFRRMLGERIDKESGLPHLAHARWGLGAMLFMDYQSTYEAFDDITGSAISPLGDGYDDSGLVDFMPWRSKEWYRQNIENKATQDG